MIITVGKSRHTKRHILQVSSYLKKTINGDVVKASRLLTIFYATSGRQAKKMNTILSVTLLASLSLTLFQLTTVNCDVQSSALSKLKDEMETRAESKILDPKEARAAVDNDFESGSSSPWFDESPGYVNSRTNRNRWKSIRQLQDLRLVRNICELLAMLTCCQVWPS